MALTPFGNFSLDWTAKPTKISGQATNFKTWLNQRTEDLKNFINDTLLAEIAAEYATKTSLAAEYATKTSLTDYATTSSLTSYETTASANEKKLRMLMGVSYFG